MCVVEYIVNAQLADFVEPSSREEPKWHQPKAIAMSVVAHSGFAALNDYRGKPDLFGRALRMTTVNVANALAVAAVLIMGEGSESTPMALISDLPFVQFQSRNPSKKELAALRIDPADDLYAPLLTSVAWQKGG